jgi:hypothetical protein
MRTLSVPARQDANRGIGIERLGRIAERNGQEGLLDVEPALVAQVASNLISNFPGKGISITNPPLTTTIESTYKAGSHLQEP